MDALEKERLDEALAGRGRAASAPMIWPSGPREPCGPCTGAGGRTLPSIPDLMALEGDPRRGRVLFQDEARALRHLPRLPARRAGSASTSDPS